MDGSEVSGADHHVGIGGHLDQRRRLLEVAVKVAEGEQFHAANLSQM
jgi:hypothetical protein